jgi:hypothetical protein
MQSLCNTAGATTGEDAHLVTDGKFFMGRQPLHNRDSTAVIQLDGDLHTLTTGNTFFNGRAGASHPPAAIYGRSLRKHPV